MGPAVRSLEINPVSGWSESFAFWLGQIGVPDLRVGACEAEAYLTDGDETFPVQTYTDQNFVTAALPQASQVPDGAYLLIVRVLDPLLPADRYALEATANVASWPA